MSGPRGTARQPLAPDAAFRASGWKPALREQATLAATAEQDGDGGRRAAAAAKLALRGSGPRPRLIAIGASTGGVEALVELLGAFPADCPPTVVVQHMPGAFTRGFAERLDSLSAPSVGEAWDGAPLETGRVWLAPGSAAHLEVVWGLRREARLVASEPVNRHRPSVDVAFLSVAREVGRGACGVLLTGMGRDGARGLLAMREAGARTYAQDRESSAVYGMPKAALEIGAVDAGHSVPRIAAELFPSGNTSKESPEWP